jgi:hypothetical protein
MGRPSTRLRQSLPTYQGHRPLPGDGVAFVAVVCSGTELPDGRVQIFVGRVARRRAEALGKRQMDHAIGSSLSFRTTVDWLIWSDSAAARVLP